MRLECFSGLYMRFALFRCRVKDLCQIIPLELLKSIVDHADTANVLRTHEQVKAERLSSLTLNISTRISRS